ncbi:protein FAM163A [Neoarius graeffei]|uniref:protein FAM163A n=1 Tax=Neoarius graeffei TaxID=443677 RepID=UPI00298BD0C1|nr:protein FAM163A [Neoarius graeffei]
MTAGTVVITGGILATVILLCIIVVLCYCRLQYYCCKQNGSDPDSPSYSEAQFSCDICRPPGMDGSSNSPLSVSPEVAHNSCPTCSSFYSNSFYLRNRDEMRNGAERIACMLPSTHGTSLSSHTFPDFYCNTHAISTDV